MTDARNFLLNTDTPLDKIIYIITGSIDVPNLTGDSIPITLVAHNLPFTPLPILQWSNTADFEITNELRDSDYIANSFTTGAGQYYSISADTTDILIQRYNFSGSTKTVYYRVFSFMPSDASEDSGVPFTANIGNNFVLNTDDNYMKLFNDGILTDEVPFDHNLGYIPRVQLWEQTGTNIGRLVGAQDISGDPTGSLGATSGVHITTTQLIWLNPNTYDKIHFRIYYDE